MDFSAKILKNIKGWLLCWCPKTSSTISENRIPRRWTIIFRNARQRTIIFRIARQWTIIFRIARRWTIIFRIAWQWTIIFRIHFINPKKLIWSEYYFHSLTAWSSPTTLLKTLSYAGSQADSPFKIVHTAQNCFYQYDKVLLWSP